MSDAQTAEADAPEDEADRSDGSGDGGHGDDGPQSDGPPSGGPESGKEKNGIEWAITGLGGALVVFVFGFLIYEWVTATGAPADLHITLGEVEQDGSFVEIPVTVENKGGKVAEGAVIEVCVRPDECSEVTFDYIPFESTVSGRVGFRGPLPAAPTTRVVSFRDP
jgi:uncharacterized protein (TIGR02588 family)